MELHHQYNPYYPNPREVEEAREIEIETGFPSGPRTRQRSSWPSGPSSTGASRRPSATSPCGKPYRPGCSRRASTEPPSSASPSGRTSSLVSRWTRSIISFFRSHYFVKNIWLCFEQGSEATEGESSRQFPFYEEMRKIVSERMERMMALNKDKGKGVQVQGDQEWGGEEEEEEKEEEQKVGEGKKKRKVERKTRVVEGEVENALREFARRQLEMEARWIGAVEAREAERRAKEEEWRRAMEALEEERKAMERRWREREEERREREEARAERRDALVTALLDKLAKDEL